MFPPEHCFSGTTWAPFAVLAQLINPSLLKVGMGMFPSLCNIHLDMVHCISFKGISISVTVIICTILVPYRPCSCKSSTTYLMMKSTYGVKHTYKPHPDFYPYSSANTIASTYNLPPTDGKATSLRSNCWDTGKACSCLGKIH